MNHSLSTRSRRCVRFAAVCFITAFAVFSGLLNFVCAASLEEMLPANVHFALVGNHFAASSKAWQATELGRLVTGEAFVPLRQTLEARNLPTLLYLRPWFGFDWQDLSSWDGPAALAVFPVSAKETGMAWVLLIDKQQPDNPPWTAGEAYFSKRGFRKSTETLGEAKITIFTDPAASRSARQPAYLVAKSAFIAADSASAAKSLWQSMNGKDSLAASADYRALGSAMEVGSDDASAIRWWIRPLELWSSLRSDERTPPSSRDWLAVVKRQGGAALTAAGGRILFPQSGKMEVDIQGGILVKRPLTKAARILEFQTAPRESLPDWLGEDLSSVSFWGWNCPNAVTAFGNYYDDLNEPGPKGEGLFQEMLAALHDDPEGPQVDLAKELFPQLGPAVFQVIDQKGRNAKGESGTRRLLFSFQCRDSAKVEKVLKQFYAGDKDVKRTTLGADPLWTIGPGRSLFVESTNSSIGNVRAVLLTPKQLMIASEPEMFDPRPASASSLTKSEPFAAVSDWWRANDADRAVACGFLQTGVSLEGPYRAVKNNAKSAESEGMDEVLRFLLTGSRQPAADFPLDKLPNYETIRAELPSLGSLLKENAAGWEVRGGILRGAK